MRFKSYTQFMAHLVYCQIALFIVFQGHLLKSIDILGITNYTCYGVQFVYTAAITHYIQLFQLVQYLVVSWWLYLHVETCWPLCLQWHFCYTTIFPQKNNVYKNTFHALMQKDLQILLDIFSCLLILYYTKSLYHVFEKKMINDFFYFKQVAKRSPW